MVDPALTITATFSEDMDASTITSTTFALNVGDQPVPADVVYDSSTRTATLTLRARLSLLVSCTATLKASIASAGGVSMAADYKWTFAVRDGQWGDAGVIETDNGGNASYPDLAIDSMGNAIAVWAQSNGTQTNTRANRYLEASGWSTATPTETNAVNDPSYPYPKVACDAGGDAIAVWTESDGTRTNIWANRYTPGSGWATAGLIETNNAGPASGVAVAMAPSGGAIAVWTQSDGTNYAIWANRYIVGSGWSTPTQIGTSAPSASFPSVAIDPAGDAVAVWNQTASGSIHPDIWANRYQSSAGWGVATKIETNDVDSAQNARVAMDASGNAIVVWNQSDGTRFNIWTNRFAVATGWGTASLLETDNAGNAEFPVIAIDGGGNAIAVWRQGDGTRDNIFATHFINGTSSGTWEAPVLLETDNGGAAGPAVAFDAAGNAVAVWQQAGGAIQNIWANRYVVGTGWGTARLIESDDAGSAGEAQIAAARDGTAVAVWMQSDGSRNNIVANTFR